MGGNASCSNGCQDNSGTVVAMKDVTPQDEEPIAEGDDGGGSEADMEDLEQPEDDVDNDNRRVRKEKIELDNGSTYEGDWLRGARDGYGVMVFPDGGCYVGQFSADMFSGKGRFEHADGDVYEGSWHDDMMHGQGTYTKVDGYSYKGEWFKALHHGKGYEMWPDGNRYDGEFRDGQKTGEGIFCWPAANAARSDGRSADADEVYPCSTFSGQFVDNIIHGQGVYTWSDGREYSGQWKKNMMHGSGAFVFPDYRKYVGQYMEDSKFGEGSFCWPDGRAFFGEWREGKQHGLGYYKERDGDSPARDKRGRWLQGKFQRNSLPEGEGSERNPDVVKVAEYEKKLKDACKDYTIWKAKTIAARSTNSRSNGAGLSGAPSNFGA